MSAYRKGFDKTKCMSFLIKDKKLLSKCNEISQQEHKKIYSEPVHSKIYPKT